LFQITRIVARQFRALLRRSVLAAAPRGPCPPVLAALTAEGLLLRAAGFEVGLSCHISAPPAPNKRLGIPGELLAHIEGGTEALVTLEALSAGRGVARWEERGASRSTEFELVPEEQLPRALDVPGAWTPLPEGFLPALDGVARTAAREAGPRFALHRVQLRGSTSQLVGTDGRQLLIHSGFDFGFSEDVLVPALPVFGSRELADCGPVESARLEDRVVIKAGPWEFDLRVDRDGRYPDAADVVPRRSGATRLSLVPDDVASLLEALRGPVGDEEDEPAVVNLGRTAIVQARGAGGVIEVALAQSVVAGRPLRLGMARDLLVRAVKLGFSEFHFHGTGRPVVACDGHRTLVLMTSETPRAARIPEPSPTLPARRGAEAGSNPIERSEPVNPQANGSRPLETAAEQSDVLAEAEALKNLLAQAATQAARLTAALRGFRRQQKAVQSVVNTLKSINP
jgi:hypothetical protein